MRRRALAVVLVVAAAVVGVAAVGNSTAISPFVADSDARSTAGASQSTEIDSCTEITEPGRYIIIRDIEDADAGQCIRVRANDVILDGEGRAVNGTGDFGTAGVTIGAWGADVSNVTVRNLTVAGWDDGVRVTDAEGVAVEDVTATESRIGVLAMNATDSRFLDVRAVGNAVHGVSLVDESRESALENVTAEGNALFGVHLGPDVRENEISDARVRGNEYGVVLAGADGNRIVGGEATDNRIAGVWLSSARDNLVADLRLSNRFYGVFLTDESANNTLRNNSAVGNAVGFRLRSADDNRLVDNNATDGRDGVLLIGSDGNLLEGNRVTDNRRGLSLFDSDDNVVRGEIRGNDEDLLVRRGSENNTLPESLTQDRGFESLARQYAGPSER